MASREFDSRKTAASARKGLAPSKYDAAWVRHAQFATEALVAAPAPAAAAAPTSFVDRALLFASAAAPAGFAADHVERSAFFADPIVQRTSVGAATVHLHQQYRGLTIFQMARAVRFEPDGRPIDAVGQSSAQPLDIDLVPKTDAISAVVKAAQHLATSGRGQTATDRFGVTYPIPTISVDGFAPGIVASFPLPSRPTVVEKGPFENPIPVYLLIFAHPDGPRLAWHAVLTFPRNEDQYTVIVSADEKAEILYSHSTMHRALARGNVFEFSPGVADRRMIDFPRPITDYPAMPTMPLADFPAPWVTKDQTLGNSTRATLGASGRTLDGIPATNPVEFNPTSAFGDDQKLLNIFYFCNYMHDFLYIIGFDEAAGNFQEVNFTHTGLGNDAVLALAHSGTVV